MSASNILTAELRAEVLRLEDDLRGRVATQPDVQAKWHAEYDDARASERTSATWEGWVDERVTLAAVAWVLTTVFIRFCEDNGLVKPVWITHAGGRHREALDAQQHFLREAARSNSDVTDREWLREAIAHLAGLPATAGLVDGTSPMWLVQPSGDAATRLLTYWRERDEDGDLLRDFTDSELDTRFLGDLYQDISEDAKKRYALLQTPVFVEEFMLDRTLEPALNERQLEGFKAIDPTCGSGHFLLGVFQRLLDRWHAHAPAIDERDRVQRALDAVHGVDLNPFAVSIARFRLTVAALQACGLGSLESAPAFKYHLAAGDSLLHGLDQGEFDFGAGLSGDRAVANFAYATENLAELKKILRNGQYDCVVGNPPYIQVKDKALNVAYRERYSTCTGKYALTVPFMERFFNLAKAGQDAGWTGQITGNAFMKREFGVTLVQEFLPTKDLRLVADTSGAYIPGHGTPTVIVVGRNARPATSTVRAVLGVRGEPSKPQDPSKGHVWSTIVGHVDDPGWDDEWVTISDLDRSRLNAHPWSLSGGGAVELLAAVERAAARSLGTVASEIGIVAVLGEEEAFELARWADEPRTELVLGEAIRDFTLESSPRFWPYNEDFKVTHEALASRWMWPYRRLVSGCLMFGKTREQRGMEWLEYSMLATAKLRTPMSIAFAFVATHNHFVLDRGARVFKQSAPVIKLPADSTEDEHLALLGVLNSSTACFWLKQNSQGKSGSGIGRGIQPEDWMERYEFTGTTLQDYPLPQKLPLEHGLRLDQLAQRLQGSTPSAVLDGGFAATRGALDAARSEWTSVHAQMIAAQEEVDWSTYRLYDLVEDELTYAGDDLPELSLGERAFEIVLARRMKAGDVNTAWFERHNSLPVTEIPDRWPAAYRELVQRRIDRIASNAFVRLMEKPEHKRRWAMESWEKLENRSVRGWVLDRLEDTRFWFDSYGRPTPKSIATLADDVSRDEDLTSVLAVWEGRPDVPVGQTLEKLLAKEAVPYLAARRYKDSGLRKRSAWESTWELQRREDAGAHNPAPKDRGGDGPIPVPPKYVSADFTRVEYWSHRGKLDVPKERFILYPDAGRETDPTPVLGWAGWDHAEQALALATLIQLRESDGWDDQRLVPLVAGLAEVLPWVQQWHDEPADLYGGASPAAFFAEQLEQRMTQVGATLESLRAWRPEPTRRGRKAKA